MHPFIYGATSPVACLRNGKKFENIFSEQNPATS
jgi:hypothetical protein